MHVVPRYVALHHPRHRPHGDYGRVFVVVGAEDQTRFRRHAQRRARGAHDDRLALVMLWKEQEEWGDVWQGGVDVVGRRCHAHT